MCIYYTDKDALHYDSEEHIIPAGIGGIAKLPKEHVSREFNRDISKLELDFIREGLISIPRPLFGPGKRGSLATKNATKSKVHIMTELTDAAQLALGYTELGKAYEIPHLQLNIATGENVFSCNREGNSGHGGDQLNLFKNKCIQVDGLRIKVLDDATLPKDLIMIGIQEGIEKNYNCFFAKNPANTTEASKENIQRIGAGIHVGQDPQFRRYLPRVQQKVKVNMEHFRIYGKIAFNFLSFIKGPELVRQPQFDAVRDWIAYGKEYSFVAMDPNNFNPLEQMGITMPRHAHIVYLIKSEQRLMAKVFLYCGFSVEILLSHEFSGTPSTDGFICDWENKKEYRLNDYLTLFA